MQLHSDWDSRGVRAFQGPTFSGTAYDSPVNYLGKQPCIHYYICNAPAVTKDPFSSIPNSLKFLHNKLIQNRIKQLVLTSNEKLPKQMYSNNQMNKINGYIDSAIALINNPYQGPTMNTFNQPNKTTVLANAEDIVLWTDLPNPTKFVSFQLGEGANNEWYVTEGFWEATFNPAGTYYFVLSADGYTDSLVIVTAVDE